jgi:broad specificity phosphatase PhoE
MRLSLFRHGDGRHNEAFRRAMKGDYSLLTPEFFAMGDENYPLTSLGEQQALWLGELHRSKGISFDELFSSPALRARQTVEISCNNQPYIVADALMEQHWGESAHAYSEEIWARRMEYYKSYPDSPTLCPPDGQSVQDHMNIVASFFQQNLPRWYAKNLSVGIGSHGGTMRAARMILQGMELERFAELFTDENYTANCQLVQFTDTDSRGQRTGRLCRVRSMSPIPGCKNGHEWISF